MNSHPSQIDNYLIGEYHTCVCGRGHIVIKMRATSATNVIYHWYINEKLCSRYLLKINTYIILSLIYRQKVL